MVEINYSGPAESKTSAAMRWTGRILTWLVAAFMLLDGGMKVVKADVVMRESAKMGYPLNALQPLGFVLCASALLFLLPWTEILGAILLTGYLGGAVATHVYIRSTMFDTLFPAIFGVIAWLGLVLKNAQLRAILPVRR